MLFSRRRWLFSDKAQNMLIWGSGCSAPSAPGAKNKQTNKQKTLKLSKHAKWLHTSFKSFKWFDIKPRARCEAHHVDMNYHTLLAWRLLMLVIFPCLTDNLVYSEVCSTEYVHVELIYFMLLAKNKINIKFVFNITYLAFWRRLCWSMNIYKHLQNKWVQPLSWLSRTSLAL